MAQDKSVEAESESIKPSGVERGTTDSPLVFISHDTRDADLAEAFANLLTDASGGIVKSFRSSDRKGTTGIEFGDEWYQAIMRKLDSATDVVALLTARSINRPWILYEAGVAKGKLNSPVLGLALGVPLEDAVTGPFAQFQNSPDDEDSITKLVLQLIKRHPEAEPRQEAIRRQVQVFREHLTGIMESRGKEPTVPQKPADTSVAKLFEEVKILVRDMPHRVAVEVAEDRPARFKKRRRIRPMLIEDLLHHPLSKEQPSFLGLNVLMVLSLFREEFPWLYDLGHELFRAMHDGDAKAIDDAWLHLWSALEMMQHGPWLEMYESSDDHEALMMLRHVTHDLERIVKISKSNSRPSKRKPLFSSDEPSPNQ